MSVEEAEEETIFAEVEMVCSGMHGGCGYVRTYTPTYGSVTFSLHHNVWKGERGPTIEEVVILSDLRYLKDKGWRAEDVRRPTPEEIKRYTGEEV